MSAGRTHPGAKPDRDYAAAGGSAESDPEQGGEAGRRELHGAQQQQTEPSVGPASCHDPSRGGDADAARSIW